MLISITGKGGPFKQILLDLYDPLGFGFRDMSAADKKKGLFAEINNGRMAMIGALPVRESNCRGASHAVGAMPSPEPRRLDGVEVHDGRSQYPQDSLAHWLISTGLFSVLAEAAVPGSNPQYKSLNIDMPTSDVDIMGSVIPQLTSPFALKAYPVLAVCALVQQQRSLKN